MRKWIVAVLLGTWIAASVGTPAPDEPVENPVQKARIEVYKAKRELVLFSGSEVLRRFRIGLGFTPTGQKARQGDGATPEGKYVVIVKNPQSRYYLSLGLNYPNPADAKRGLEAGLINEAQYEKFVESAERGKIPPWNTELGGEIYIHGNGSSSDWTLGCIALDDADMKELFHAAAVGTPVIIQP